MPSIDIAIEIVDARIPDSSSNHVLEQIVGDKPIIKVLSKMIWQILQSLSNGWTTIRVVPLQ